MENRLLDYSNELKNKYGPAFFTNELRRSGAPLTVNNNNQIFGMLDALLTFLRNQRDNSINDIITYIDNISNLRTDNDRTESLRLLENLGINIALVTRNAPPTNFSLIAPTPIPENTENTEKASYLTGLPQDAECPICLEKLNGSGYATEKCRNFFHKECLDEHCLRKNICPCPMCRRELRFINKSGGKKRRTRKNKIKKSSRKNRKNTRSRKR